MKNITYEVQYLVKKDNSISGEEYWSTFQDGKFDDLSKARHISRHCQKSTTRIVEVSRRVIWP